MRTVKDSCSIQKHKHGISLPMPLLVVVEDVGWWSGYDRSHNNEPFRTGMNRRHCPEDYTALARLGRTLGTQVMAGFVLCEWDNQDLLRELPSSTWKGEQWQGPMKGSPLPGQAAAILRENRDVISVAMHGVGHEYWENGIASRTEFHTEAGEMRDRNEVSRHIDMFFKLLEATGISDTPMRVFIPPALRHSFGNGEHGFQKILADYGIHWVLTVFDKAGQHSPPQYPGITSECGVTLLERGLSPVNWNQISAEPAFSFDHPVLPLHWANILHHDPALNYSVVNDWSEFLLAGANHHNVLFLPTVEATLTQIVYYYLTKVQEYSGRVILDISKAREMLPLGSDEGVYVTISSGSPASVTGGDLSSVPTLPPGYFRIVPSGSNRVVITV